MIAGFTLKLKVVTLYVFVVWKTFYLLLYGDSIFVLNSITFYLFKWFFRYSRITFLQHSSDRNTLMRYFYFRFVTIPLGGPACCFCVPVSDLLTRHATICWISKSGATTLDVWSSSNYILQVNTLWRKLTGIGIRFSFSTYLNVNSNLWYLPVCVRSAQMFLHSVLILPRRNRKNHLANDVYCYH